MPEYTLTRLRGEWAIAWYEDGTDDAGRPIRRRRRFSLGTADRKAAEQKADEQWSKLTQPEVITVDSLWRQYRKENEGKRTAANMEFSGRAVLPFFGHLKPEQIDVEKCRAYEAKRRKDRTKWGLVQTGTIWTELNHLQIVLNWAKKRRIIEHEIAVQRPPKPAPRNRRITRAEGRRLIDAAKFPHIALAIHLMLGTGARVGAILDLTWDRVDLKRRQIAYADPNVTEGRKGRATVSIPHDLLERLEKAKKGAETEYVIEWAAKPVKSIKKGFAQAVENAKLENVTPHALRHTAATWMAEAGIPIDKIAQVLGHSNPAITYKVYAKFTPEHLADAAAALDMSGVPPSSDEPGEENEE